MTNCLPTTDYLCSLPQIPHRQRPTPAHVRVIWKFSSSSKPVGLSCENRPFRVFKSVLYMSRLLPSSLRDLARRPARSHTARSHPVPSRKTEGVRRAWCPTGIPNDGHWAVEVSSASLDSSQKKKKEKGKMVSLDVVSGDPMGRRDAPTTLSSNSPSLPHHHIAVSICSTAVRCGVVALSADACV